MKKDEAQQGIKGGKLMRNHQGRMARAGVGLIGSVQTITSRTPALALVTALVTSCGGKSGQKSSDLNWEKSRGDSDQYAYLWPRDLEDTFILGAQVIETSGTVSSTLSFTLRPTKVKLLELEEELGVFVEGEGEAADPILRFNLKKDGQRLEVDFASAANDLEFVNLVDYLGGIYTASDRMGYWISDGAPEVVKVSQDNHTVMVDLKHHIKPVIIAMDPFGVPYIAKELSEEPGEVVLRLYLRRQGSIPTLVDDFNLSVATARENGVGYFGTSIASDDAAENIQRMPLDDLTVGGDKTFKFYLKDFPAEFEQVGKEAVLSWNEAFGKNLVEVEVAGADVDAADPRLNVIKWFDNTDDSLSWAGIAKMQVDPDTGIVFGGHVFIQGNRLVDMYKGISDYNEKLRSIDFQQVGSLGGVDFTLDEGENPVFPYMIDPNVDFKTYMQGYYREVVIHEVGHVLGLRHNFKASTKLDANELPSSVMDYSPRAERNKASLPGSYDKAAIQYGYFGTAPTDIVFCTDEDVEADALCNRGDMGDPVKYAIRGLVDGTALIAQSPFEAEKVSYISAIADAAEIAVKLFANRDQLTPAQAAEVTEKVPMAVRFALNALPSANLDEEGQKVARKNLQTVKDKITEVFKAQMDSMGL